MTIEPGARIVELLRREGSLSGLIERLSAEFRLTPDAPREIAEFVAQLRSSNLLGEGATERSESP